LDRQRAAGRRSRIRQTIAIDGADPNRRAVLDEQAVQPQIGVALAGNPARQPRLVEDPALMIADALGEVRHVLAVDEAGAEVRFQVQAAGRIGKRRAQFLRTNTGMALHAP
jgi:hypothetical protein